MNILDIISKKKNKEELNEQEIKFFVSGYTNGEILDYQMSSLLMAIVLNGMTYEETYFLTREFANSGKNLKWEEDLKEKVIDKHSTGGVGDKVTIVMMPILRSLGYIVPKMSGRGLGYTGGTADKLESIDGFNIDFNSDKLIENTKKIGICLATQSNDFTIADKKIYELRDATGTTESIPLIASSIMSKKIALGAKKLILDVTVGSGAFMKSLEKAEELAEIMKEIAEKSNIDTRIYISNMDIPLGYTIGNKLEVEEAIDILKGKYRLNSKYMKDKEIIEILNLSENEYFNLKTNSALDLTYEMILDFVFEDRLKKLKKENENEKENKKENIDTKISSDLDKLKSKLKSEIEKEVLNIIYGKKAYKVFLNLMKNQIDKGESLNETELEERLVLNKEKVNISEIKSLKEGYITKIDAYKISKAAFLLGTGRLKKEDKISYNSGIKLNIQIGDYVKKNDIILSIYNELNEDKKEENKIESTEKNMNDVLVLIDEAIEISEKKEDTIMIYEII